MKNGIKYGPCLDIESSSYEELLVEYDDCQDLWGKYSCDCFGFYIDALKKRIVELGGWPIEKGSN